MHSEHLVPINRCAEGAVATNTYVVAAVAAFTILLADSLKKFLRGRLAFSMSPRLLGGLSKNDLSTIFLRNKYTAAPPFTSLHSSSSSSSPLPQTPPLPLLPFCPPPSLYPNLTYLLTYPSSSSYPLQRLSREVDGTVHIR